MSGLRESKKAATRSALARAAAEIALRDGADGLTVASIAATAGVSPRTFHNYFSAREEALLEFVTERVQAIAGQITDLPADLELLAAVEEIVIGNLHSGDSELESFATLFRLDEIIATLSPATNGRPELGTVLEPLMPIMRERLPRLNDFEAHVAVGLIAEAVATALRWHYSTPAPRDPADGEQLVRQATRLLRLS